MWNFRRYLLGPACAALLVGGGCFVRGTVAQGGACPREEELDWILPRKTTRSDVLFHLGRPSKEEGRLLIYESSSGRFTLVAPLAIEIPGNRVEVLAILLAEDGTVHDFFRIGATPGTAEGNPR